MNTPPSPAPVRVRLNYTLSTEDELVDTTEGSPPLWVELGRGQLHPAIEARIGGLAAGTSFDFFLDPSLAFGVRDPQLKLTLRKSKIPEELRDLKTGDTFTAPGPDKKPKLFRVLEAKDYTLLVEGNHPLAGKTLHVQGTVEEVVAPQSAD